MIRGGVVRGCALLAVITACGGDDATTARVSVEGLDSPLRVEVADDRGERVRGLSGRADVPAGTGMLFVYGSADQREFWMHETLVPLDIAWLRDGRVLGVTTMQPCRARDAGDCERYPSPGDVDSALEAPAGTFAEVRTGAGVDVQ